MIKYISVMLFMIMCLFSLEASAQTDVKGTEELKDVLSVYNGAFPLETLNDLNAINLISGVQSNVDYYFSTQANGDEPEGEIIFTLPAPALIQNVQIRGPQLDTCSPRQVEIAIASSSEANFLPIAVFEIKASDIIPLDDPYSYVGVFNLKQDVAKQIKGKFIRIKAKGSHDPKGQCLALKNVHAFGVFEAYPEINVPEITGIYNMTIRSDRVVDFIVLNQQESVVQGCGVTALETDPFTIKQVKSLFTGALEGGILNFTMHNLESGETKQGLMTFSPQGELTNLAIFSDGDPTVYGNVILNTGQRLKDQKLVTCTPGQSVEEKSFGDKAQQTMEQDLEKEGVTRLYGINFDFDSDKLQPQSYAVLKTVAQVAHNHPDWKFEVAGHTDGSGSDNYNQKLSERRAEAVVNYLLEAGVPKMRLIAAGYGATRPLLPNDKNSEAARAKNRRVELIKK